LQGSYLGKYDELLQVRRIRNEGMFRKTLFKAQVFVEFLEHKKRGLSPLTKYEL
jgi:hypothetical protein